MLNAKNCNYLKTTQHLFCLMFLKARPHPPFKGYYQKASFFVLIPPNCTNKLQPLDISINKRMKDALKDQFQMLHAQEVQNQLQGGSQLEDEVKIDTSMTTI